MQEHARIAVVGAGTMGNGIAHVFAQFGHPVTLIDVDEQRLTGALKTIGGNLDRQIKKGALSEEAKSQTLERISTATSLEAARGAGLAIEAVPEKLEMKQAIFSVLDGILAADAILASNTSSISITTLAAGTRRPDRFIGMSTRFETKPG